MLCKHLERSLDLHPILSQTFQDNVSTAPCSVSTAVNLLYAQIMYQLQNCPTVHINY
jgi:hypothetical protein